MKRLMNVTATLALALAASSALAGDEQYPAYNFQPTVIYSNAELITKTSGATAGVVSAPASASAASAPVGEFDPKYPVAYFVPSVIYPAK
jgi:chitodextrinase